MLKILQERLQQYVNYEIPDVQAGFRKGRGTRDQIANIRWIIEKAREFQKTIYFCFFDYAKAFDCVDQEGDVVPLSTKGHADGTSLGPVSDSSLHLDSTQTGRSAFYPLGWLWGVGE